jgi:hypothetical protein
MGKIVSARMARNILGSKYNDRAIRARLRTRMPGGWADVPLPTPVLARVLSARVEMERAYRCAQYGERVGSARWNAAWRRYYRADHADGRAIHAAWRMIPHEARRMAAPPEVD